jgi:RimJ/RimL family protein N-acetyltransferase
VPYYAPFNAHRVTIIIKTVHHRSVEVALRYGFQGEGILKNHFGGEDGTILRRLRPKDLEA